MNTFIATAYEHEVREVQRQLQDYGVSEWEALEEAHRIVRKRRLRKDLGNLPPDVREAVERRRNGTGRAGFMWMGGPQ